MDTTGPPTPMPRRLAKDQDGLVIWAHFPYPNGECPVDVALGKIDAFDLLTTGDPFELHPTLQRIYKMYGPSVYQRAPIDLFYDYLNCGFRISASAGSDKMSTSVPMGSARVYVQTGSKLDYPGWIEGLRSGQTFISTGPMIELSVDDKGPGDEIGVPAPPPESSYSVLVKAILPLSHALRETRDHPQRQSGCDGRSFRLSLRSSTRGPGFLRPQRLGGGSLLWLGDASLWRSTRSLVPNACLCPHQSNMGFG